MSDKQKGRVSSKRSLGTRYSDLNKKFKVLIVFGIIFCICGVPLIVWGSIWAFNTFAIGGGDLPDTPLTVSTFTLKSAVDGEDVSNFCEMDIWLAKSGADFSEGMEDVTALTTNFERKETGKDADDISLDFSDETYIWAEITGNTVFNNTFYLLYGGINRDYILYPHHTSSDINFNILNSTFAGMSFGAGYGWLQGVNDNYTGVLNAPIYTTTEAEMHYGVGWDVSATEFADMSLREQEIFWNEINWRDQFPTYDPTLDTINEYDRDFERITNAPALKWTFNASINVTDGSDTEINCTIGRGYPIETFISGTDLYMVWYEGFNFKSNPYTFEFEMWFGTKINVTTVISCRVDIPGSLSTVSLSETYSTIGT